MSRTCLAPTDPYTRRSVSEDALHVNKHERVQSESGKGKPTASGLGRMRTSRAKQCHMALISGEGYPFAVKLRPSDYFRALWAKRESSSSKLRIAFP